MAVRLKTKDDIEFHSEYFRNAKPAVNVKVRDSLEDGYKEWRKDYPDEDPEFTVDWIRENVGESVLDDTFWSMVEYRWDDLEHEAREIWGWDRIGTSYRVEVYSEGRSGGWAVVTGINLDVDSWDAIEFSKWKRFAKFARATADHIMWDVVDSVYNNAFLLEEG